MNVLSLFDGMSCGMIALDRLGIKVDNYYASEIDKYAMQVSAANYPEIIQVGDITKLDLSTLPKIDLVMGVHHVKDLVLQVSSWRLMIQGLPCSLSL
jgi:site-specific DNA-cytosine methylase